MAGLGTRFLPATKATPKEMLPLVDKPLIQYVLEEAIAAGITEIIMVTGRNKNAIEDHFDRSVELELLLEGKGATDLLNMTRKITDMCDISYIRQKEPKGLGHAILRAKNLVGDEPFAVLLGDDIIYSTGKPGIAQLTDVFDKKQAPVIAVEKIPMENISAYGVIDYKTTGEDMEITELVEKPPADKAPSDLAIIGRYVLTPEIFEYIERTEPDAKGEIQLTTALNAMLGSSSMFACQFDGIRYDAGDKLGFLKATVEFALRRDDLGADFKKYLKKLPL